MIDHFQTAIDAVTQLTSGEQLELIATVSRSLQKQLQSEQRHAKMPEFAPPAAIPAEVRRTPPLQHISQLKADFWPDDETADAINDYLAQQRREDLLREQNEYGAA